MVSSIPALRRENATFAGASSAYNDSQNAIRLFGGIPAEPTSRVVITDPSAALPVMRPDGRAANRSSKGLIATIATITLYFPPDDGTTVYAVSDTVVSVSRDG